MFMKESINSLRAYFIFIAFLGMFSSIPLLLFIAQPLVMITGLILFLLNLTYLIMGIFLKTFLSKWLWFIRTIIIGNLVVILVFNTLNLYQHVEVSKIIWLLFSTLITWYLWVNVNRLAKELA
jgi:hypothetical protein